MDCFDDPRDFQQVSSRSLSGLAHKTKLFRKISLTACNIFARKIFWQYLLIFRLSTLQCLSSALQLFSVD